MIPLAISSLLLGGVLQILLPRFVSARIKGVLAALSCVPALFAIAAAVPAIRAGGTLDFSLGSWDIPSLFALHVDGLSVLFAAMGVFLGGCVLLYSIGYMAHEAAAKRFYVTMLVFIGGFVVLVCAANLLAVYVCWEIVGLCSFSLVGFWYTNPEAVHGARKVLLMTHIAGYGLLAAILVLYHRTGSLLWTDPAVSHAFTGGVFALMLIAIAAKSVQVPLHTWIPDAMAAPTPVSALLHAACYVTSGVYLTARLHSLAAWPQLWSLAVVTLGSVTILVGVMYAMVQADLKRMLAFSTVSQIGYMILGLGIGTPLAIVAGLLHCLTHGFFKGGLFLCAGSVQHATGTRNMNELGGLAERMPCTTLCWLAGAGSMMGIPLLSGFVSKWLIYAAALQSGWIVPALVAWIASLGTVFLCAKATSAVFLGPATARTESARESAPTMQWGMALLAAGNVVLGVAPQLAVNVLLLPIVRGLGLPDGVQVSWFGLSASAASFSTMGGLVLAIVSVIAGGVIYAFVHGTRPVAATASGGVLTAGGGIFTGGEPLHTEARLTVADFAEIFQHNWRDFFRWSNVDGLYAAMSRGVMAAARAAAVLVAWMERRGAWLLCALAALIYALVAFVAPGTTSSGSEVVLASGGTVSRFFVASCSVAAMGLLLAALTGPQTRRHVPMMLLIVLATLAGLSGDGAWPRLLFLEAGALLTAALVWRTVQSRAARWTYLSAVALSAGCAVLAQVALGAQQQPTARNFTLTGIAVKLAVIPLMFWLLRVADELPAAVLGLIVAVVDIAAFGEFLMETKEMPGLLTPPVLLLAAAAATALCGAFLMLAQRSLKRLLVLSTVEDVGFLLLGASAMGWASTAADRAMAVDGVLFAAAAHAVAKALLFTSLAAPDADGALGETPHALAARYPWSAFGFLFGMLTMLGVPPTLGFAGRWRLYSVALAGGPWLLAVFVAASVCALAAYVLALTQGWWGPAADGDEAVVAREPRVLIGVIVALVALVLVAGVGPMALFGWIGGRP